VSLDSSDPTTKPKIMHNYYSDPDDLQTAVAGTKIGLDIARQQSLQKFTGTWFRQPPSQSEDDLRKYVRQYTHSIFHGASTCSMGKVVDSQLRVLGIDGLRVADVSVMPKPGRGAPNASAIMIGEKAADMIRGVAPLSPATAAVAAG
jgi:choline dehydrogenase